MTFEEFFKKKKISLQLLQQTEPALFLEFEMHYSQMGEKSFDHTKKYWFNQLRRKFPAPPEVKVEKVIIENPIAEQTIADTLTEPATSAPNVGFKPRFKAGMASKPAAEQLISDKITSTAEENATTNEAPKPAIGFKPKFRASTPPKQVAENTEAKANVPVEEEKPAPALGFKPKFRASTPPKQVNEPEQIATSETEKGEPANEPSAETTPKPVGFKPRFNAKNIKTKED